MDDVYLVGLYIAMVGPSLLLAKETRTRLLNLKSGVKALLFLPFTVGVLVIYVFFGKDLVSQIPLLNLSWLGYNIAQGQYYIQAKTDSAREFEIPNPSQKKRRSLAHSPLKAGKGAL